MIIVRVISYTCGCYDFDHAITIVAIAIVVVVVQVFVVTIGHCGKVIIVHGHCG